jgi:hypothetical protein
MNFVLQSPGNPSLLGMIAVVTLGLLAIPIHPPRSQTPTAEFPPAWTSITTTDAPSRRDRHVLVWTGSELIVWGGQDLSLGVQALVSGGGRYDPRTNRWRPLSRAGEPRARVRPVVGWTGQEVLVWGGVGSGGSLDGARYDPLADRWTPMSVDGAPQGYDAVGVWDGEELLVYSVQAGQFDGARYDPQRDRWTPMNSSGAPTLTDGLGVTAALVWTGTELMVWGGTRTSGGASGNRTCVSEGGLYDPHLDRWRPLSNPGFLTPRHDHAMVWTGEEVLIWGGGFLAGECLEDPTLGGRYRPSDDSWAPITTENAPDRRRGHHAFWTGQEMLIWGGLPVAPVTRFNGARYDPVSDTWTETEPIPFGDLQFAYFAPAVWTGHEFMVWGGTSGSRTSAMSLQTGARFVPYWLQVQSPTEVYSLDDRWLRMAESKEWFKVTDRAGGYALVVPEGMGGDQSVWIALDHRVILSERSGPPQ